MMSGRALLSLLVGFAIDCARWSQLLPMLLVWGVAAAMVLAILLVGREEALVDGAVGVLVWLYELPWLGNRLRERAGAQETLTITGADVQWILSWGWLGASVLASGVAALVRWIRGPVGPLRYRTRMLAVVLATIVIGVGFLGALALGGEQVAGDGLDWLPTVLGTTVLVFIVGAWSQSAVHVLGVLKQLIQRVLDDGDPGSAVPGSYRDEPWP